MMNCVSRVKRAVRAGLAVLVLGMMCGTYGMEKDAALTALLPDAPQWSLDEDSQMYYPESLFEYINGAAEIYLSYEFKQLIVAQYQKDGSDANLGVEIYEMATPTTAFGIYSAERYPDNAFVDIGQQGYLEEGTLNFLAGRYYVKLLCFDCGEETESILRRFAQSILERAKIERGWPAPLRVFPEKDRIPNTEKFILKNFLGYGFLHDGYSASFQAGGLEFDCFLVDGGNPDEAGKMLDRFLKSKGGPAGRTVENGYLIRDRYYKNIYLVQTGRYLCGVMKIKEGFEETGERYLRLLVENIRKLK